MLTVDGLTCRYGKITAVSDLSLEVHRGELVTLIGACHGKRVAARAIVVQQKTSRPVQFEITESTRTALADWIRLSGLASDDFLFPSRVHASPHLSTRQYARIVDSWVQKSVLIRPLTEPIPAAAPSRL